VVKHKIRVKRNLLSNLCAKGLKLKKGKKTNMQQNLKPRQKNHNGGQKERVSLRLFECGGRTRIMQCRERRKKVGW
jgi:hypothetical protein